MTHLRHGPWTIQRSEWLNEWEATHTDYDASWEGEEDGWVSNGLHTSAKTVPDLLDEIEELERWKGLPVTPREAGPMTLPLALAAYALGATITLAGLVMHAGYRGQDVERFLTGSVLAALTWPIFLPALAAWLFGKALRKRRY